MSDLLRQPLEAIEQVQNERLRAMLALCARGHPYYRERWAKAGIDVAEIRTVADLERLPLTPKQDLMAAPEAFRLHLPDLPLHERVLWEVIYTTGSTAEPTPVYNTTHDYHAYLFQARRVAEISGIGAADVIANLFPLTPAPMGAFVRSASNAYAAGASIFAALPGAPHGHFGVQRSLDQAVHAIALHRATILWGVPSFVRRVLLRAIEFKADFSSVRMCAITGEASSAAMREELRRCLRELGAAGSIVFDRYGSTELGAFAQCREESDWHNPAPEIQYHEVVDADSGRRLADGERGALAVTHLDRRGTVLIRFTVGDTVSLDRAPCPHCGRTSERVVGPVVRTKDLVKVKGMLINPAVLLETLQGLPGVVELQVVVGRMDASDPFSMDEMVVRVATDNADHGAMAALIADKAQEAVRVRPRIEFAAAAEIYDAGHQTKAKRFVDTR
ncbi:MAG TPA: AMP-binding protein [Burkholderiales bacterium]|jgi:phenylacetate-coenzyme A ligase PaaK-like adenylate-forming protein|nr:AMP-binding protein [Burkholderiales bacterium]